MSYFWFYLIQVFIVTTLSSGVTSAATKLVENPASIAILLATSLPQASNFYLCYITVQGFQGVAQTLLQIFPLILYWIKGGFANTPRSKFHRWIDLRNPNIGSLYPVYTVMLIIAIAYSCIAPLILGFAGIGLVLFYFTYRYMFLYVYNIPYDTKGLMYSRALQQIFVGLYLAQGCMIGLFAIDLGNSRSRKGVLGPFVLMIILVVSTALYHASLNFSLQPLRRYLPKTLETEERRLLADEDPDTEAQYSGFATPISRSRSESAEVNQPGTSHVEFPNTGRGLTGKQVEVEKAANQRSSGENIEGKGPVKKKESEESNETNEELYDKELPPTPKKKKEKPGIVSRFLRPDLYEDYYTLRKLVPRTFANINYDQETESEAYFHPAILSPPPILWVPKDDNGVSAQEVRDTSKVVQISNQGAHLDEKSKIVWDSSISDVPIAKEKIYW